MRKSQIIAFSSMLFFLICSACSDPQSHADSDSDVDEQRDADQDGESRSDADEEVDEQPDADDHDDGDTDSEPDSDTDSLPDGDSDLERPECHGLSDVETCDSYCQSRGHLLGYCYIDCRCEDKTVPTCTPTYCDAECQQQDYDRGECVNETSCICS